MQAYFYRTAVGAEVDLLLDRPGGERWAIEIKRSLSPELGRGFHAACEDLQPTRQWLVYPGTERFRMSETVEVLPLPDLVAQLWEPR